MDEATLKKLRFAPVLLTILIAVVVWQMFRGPDHTTLILATGTKGGLYHRLGEQMKTAIEKAHPDLRIHLQSSAGSNENIRQLDAKKAQLGLVQNDAHGGQAVRSLAALYPEVLHLITRTNAGIATLADLPGKRLGIGAAGSGTAQITTNILEFADVALEANQTVAASLPQTMAKLKAGQLDAAFLLTGLGSPAIRDALADPALALAAVRMPGNGDDPKAIAEQFTDGFRVHYPYVSPRVIPQLAYRGQPTTPVPSLSVQAVLVCHREVDAEIIERIARTLFTQRAVLAQKEPAFTYLDETAAGAGLQFPLHEGADNFYRRKEPGFFAENVEVMGFILTVFLLIWSVASWVRNWYLQRKKNRIDTYYEAVEDVIRRLHDGTDLQEIEELEAELLKIRQRASAELVAEQLAADESFVIYQNMLNGCQAMLVRMRERIKESPDAGKPTI